MPGCDLRLARLHPPLAGCHLCSAGLTATTAGLRMPPWARARHQSHRHQQGWSRQGLDNLADNITRCPDGKDSEEGGGWGGKGRVRMTLVATGVRVMGEDKMGDTQP